MAVLRAVLVLTLLCVAPAHAQMPANADATVLEGAWIRMEAINPSGVASASPPAVRTFVDGYYSWVQATAGRTTPDSTATAAQLRAAWGPVTANSGRYEVVGHTMTQRPLADKVPTGMASGAFQTFAIRLVADTMWITQIANSDAKGPLTNQGSGKYVRVR